MKLKKLLEGVDTLEGCGNNPDIDSVEFDSRKVGRGALFAAVSGTAVDGHKFIGGAIEKGAAAVLCEKLPTEPDPNTAFVVVEDTNTALGQIAANFYDNPSRKLHLVGITGTNGKTTTVTLLYELFERLGYKSGLISTVVYRVHDREYPSTHTTPDAVELNRLLAEMVDCGCQYCFMEVSSHSLVQHRTEGLHFAGAIFSNITHDHLDYHKTFAEYIRAKKMLFDSLSPEAWALTNADDRNGEVMLQNCRAKHYCYSLRGVGDHNARIVEMTLEGMLLELDGTQMWVRLLGRFNAYNVLAVETAAELLGANREEVLTALSMLPPVSGRFESIRSDEGVTAIVDYAHTPDALENVADTVRSLGVARRLTIVCGCGGDRDRTKRPEMAAIAVEKADLAIFTSDNPRTENPEAILDEMLSGVGVHRNYLVITDRRQAIRAALQSAERDDVVLVAGKGHEDYQITGTEKHHFSDREEIVNFFKHNK